MRVDRRLAIVTFTMAAVAIAGCGGGDGASPSPVPAPAPAPAPAPGPASAPAPSPAASNPTLTIESPPGSAFEGGAPITLSLAGAAALGGNIVWAMNPAIGTLSSTSSTGAVYTPPAVGLLTAATNVSVTATPSNGPASAVTFTIALNPFAISATTPAPGVAANADLRPGVQFSRAVDPASLGASALTLASPIGPVPASVAASGATVTLTPRSALVWGGHYTMSVAASVASLVGQTLGTAVSFDFDVTAPTWNGSASLQGQAGQTPGLAFDRGGHAFAVWQSGTLNAARFDIASRTWSAPVALQTIASGAQHFGPPTLAVDAAGDVMAVWAAAVSGSATPLVFASRFDAGTQSWAAPVLIQSVSNRSVEGPPQVATDPAGDAVAIWPQSTNSATEYRMYAAHFDAGTGQWSPATGMSLADDATMPHVAMDTFGNAMAVWSEGTTRGTPTLHAARWSAVAASWSDPTAIPGAAGSSSAISTGNLVVWTEYLGLPTLWSVQNSYIKCSRFDSNSGSWSTPQRLSAGTSDQSSAAQVQADASGNEVVVWRQTTSLGDVVSSARFDARSGTWSAPVTLETVADTSGWRYPPTVVVDPAGNVTAIWDRRAAGADLSSYFPFFARFDSHLGTWSAAAPLPGAGALFDVVGATVDEQGDVLTGWSAPAGNALSWSLLGGS